MFERERRCDNAPAATSRPTLLWVQIAIFTLFVGTIVLAPPRRGAMLLVPLTTDPVAAINVALAHRATLLGAGPLPGSVIVSGDRDMLLLPLIRQGALVMAATPVVCGDISNQIEFG